MKHVCPKCSATALTYGYPAYLLLERACEALLKKEFLIFDDFLSTELLTGSVKQVLNFMEHKGYLLSTEISSCHVAIIPNITRAWFHPEIEAFCWCLNEREIFS